MPTYPFKDVDYVITDAKYAGLITQVTDGITTTRKSALRGAINAAVVEANANGGGRRHTSQRSKNPAATIFRVPHDAEQRQPVRDATIKFVAIQPTSSIPSS
jgi:hypothetical protein